VADDATAFGDRSRPYMIELNSSWTYPEDSDYNIGWTRKVFEDLQQRFSRGGGYLNMSCYDEDGEVFVKDTFGPTWGRLREIKKKYDPANLFRMNYNILPAE
jgi:FAD/FMN-containing dehydrogenase